MARADLPLKVLLKSLNSTIFVKLKDNTEYIGVLEKCDPCMNLVLSSTKQIKEDSSFKTNYGKILIRGSSILYISVDASKVEFLEAEES